MDDTQEDSKYVMNYGLNHLEDDDDDDDEQVEEDTEEGQQEKNGSIQQNGDDDNDDEQNHEVDDEGEDQSGRNKNVNLHRHPKKRKLKSLLSSYELAPRVPSPLVVPPVSMAKPSFGGRNTLTDWSEHETFVLLEAWGDRYLQDGRKSLRSDEWQEVAEIVSHDSKIERTDSQCRNRLDTLKKKYKKEKSGLVGKRGVNTKWVYFKKMDMLLSSNPKHSSRVNSVEIAFLNPANGADEMRDSGGDSDSLKEDDDDDSDLLPPKKLKLKEEYRSLGGGSFRLLADSIDKFSEIYEKIENGKIQKMIELEKMRMDFHRDLEVQKTQIVDRVQIEIMKLRQGDYEENISG